MTEPAIAHPRIAPGKVTKRAYQEAIAAEAVERNTLVILPTGMGKTIIALLVLAERLADGGRALLLAPTKPLVEQHGRSMGDLLVDVPVRVLTGEVSPDERAVQWAAEGVTCSTPQVLANDLARGTARLDGVKVLVFDEAHRAVGDYAYVAIGKAYRAAEPRGRVLGMTASPGADPEKIAEVMGNLGIDGIEIRTESDPDVAPYVQPVRTEWVEVALPPALQRIGTLLRAALREAVADLQRAGMLPAGEPNMRTLLEAQRRLQARVQEGDAREAFHLLSSLARALKLSHAVDMVETQGVASARAYFRRLEDDPSRAAKAMLRDARVDDAVRQLTAARVEHPKMRKVALLLQEGARSDPAKRAIVFAHYRDTAEVLEDELSRVEGLRPARFVGQASRGEDRGMSQKEQQRILDAFRAGEHNVLIATSVAEEGLDVPAVDLVVFYEPVPSEIRSIQRRGRTGRHRPGRVVVLLTKETRDVAAYWTAKRKERVMRDEVAALRARFGRVNASWERPQGQATLAAFGAMEVQVEHRVAHGSVANALRARGLALKPDALPGATFRAGGLVVRVVDPAEAATAPARARVDAEVRALRKFPEAVVVLIGTAGDVLAEAARGWRDAGLRVERADDAETGAAVVAALVGRVAA